MALPATDNFNRADANPIGGNWTTITGASNVKIVSNEAFGTATDINCSVRWNADAFNDDQYSKIKQTSAIYQKNHGPLARVASAANTSYRFSQESSSVCRVFKVITGTATQIGADYSHTYAQGDVLGLAVSGQDASAVITPSLNGVDQATRAGVSGINSGSAGFRVVGQTQAVDDWEGGNVGGASGTLQATSTGTSTLTIAARATAKAESSIAGVGTLTPSIKGRGKLSATSSGVASLTLSIRGLLNLSATSAGIATVTAKLHPPSDTMQASIAGSSSLTAISKATGRISAASTGLGQIQQANLRLIARMAALSTGSSSLAAKVRASGGLSKLYALMFGTGTIVSASIGPPDHLVGLSKANYVETLGGNGLGISFLTKRQIKRIGR